MLVGVANHADEALRHWRVAPPSLKGRRPMRMWRNW